MGQTWLVRTASATCLSVLLLTCGTGCPAVSNLPAPGRTLTEREPETGREYRLYLPTRYTPERQWSLVVSCHGTRPFDTAESQFTEWIGLAEEKGFLVVAPELIATTALAPSTQEQIRRQTDDENAILAIVRSVRGAYAIEESRIFLTGWSAGSYAVIYTGLRHPEVFRALAVRQGNFDPAYFEPCVPFMDRFQPVLIMYGNIDFLKKDAEASIAWLRSHDMEPTIVERMGTHRRDPIPVYSFFADIVRHRPWVRLQVRDDPLDAMRATFSARTSFQPVNYLWDFGDGQRSTSAAPDHRYERPGLYTVRVAAYAPGAKSPYVRQIQLQVPRVRLGVVVPPATAPEL